MVARPHRYPQLLLNWGLSAGTILATLAVGEAAFRLLGIDAEWHAAPQEQIMRPGRPEGASRFWGIPFSIVRTVYDSDPRGYFGPGNAVDSEYNSVGWRGGEHVLAKPAGTLRILGLGDSYLWGQGVRYEDVVLTRVGALLAPFSGGRRVEVVNAGISGFNTTRERDLLRARGLAYQPDLVIVHFVLNDVEDDLDRPGPKVEFLEDYTAQYLSPDALSRWSNLWAWGRQRLLVSWRARNYVRHCVATFREDNPSWLHCRQALSDIQTTCEQHDIALLVVVFPFFYQLNGDYPFQPIHDAVRRHCEQHGLPVLDLRESYRGFDGPELWVHPTDQHPNEIAHAIAARAIVEYLKGHPDLLAPRLPHVTANSR